MATNTVKVELVGHDKSLGKSFRNGARSANAFSDKVKKAAKFAAKALAGIAIAVGVTVVAAFTKGVIEAAKFEEQMDKIRGLVGATAPQMEMYSDAILDMGAAYGVSAKEAADAMYFITGVGFKGKLAVDVLNETVKATATGLGDAADIAKALTRVISVYGKQNITAAKTADILTAAVNYGNMEADELAKNVSKVIPMAKILGVTWDEVAGLMAASSLGMDVDEAAVAMRGFWMALIKPKAEGIKALEDVGLSYANLRKIVKDQGTIAAMRELRDAFGGNVDEMVKVVGEARAVTGMLNLLGLDAAQVDEILAKVKDSTGALDKAWGTVSEGTAVKFRKATEGIKSVMIKLGAAALPAVKDVLTELTEVWLPRFSDWVSEHKEEIKKFFLKIAEKIKEFGQYLIEHWEEIAAALSGIWTAAVKLAEAVNAIVDAFQWLMSHDLKGWIADVAGGTPIPGGGTVTVHGDIPTGTVPAHDIGPATGGITTGPMSGYTATLHGTELVTPLNGNAFDPKVYDYGGGFGTTIVNVFLDGKLIEKQVTRRQSERLRRLERAYA